MRFSTLGTILGSAAVSLLVTSASGHVAFAQATAVPDGKVVRPNAVIHTVTDLNRSVAFYRDAVGLELDSSPALPSGSGREIGLLTNAPGAEVRTRHVQDPRNGGADSS